MMTYNNTIQLFDNIATAHKQINTFGTGELWEVNGIIKPELKGFILWVAPVNTTITDQTTIRTFTVLVMNIVKKDKSDEQEVLSDSEQILIDIIKIFRNEDEAYELVGDPTLFPFKEDFGDWLTGYRTDLVIQTDFNNNYCDLPIATFNSPTT